MPKIPVGWLQSSPMGKPVDGTKFLAFKVPLKETLCRNISPNNRFSPAMLLEEAPQLSMIIDLTNTCRYYDKNEFTKNGIKHYKILCPGKVVPSRKVVKQFFFAVDTFMETENNNEKLIGVHCTHGINRTGYFICMYMIHRMGFKPDDAIRVFQEARGHDIIRDYLVNDLKNNIYSEDKELPTNLPDSFRSRKSKHSAKAKKKSNSQGGCSNIVPQFYNSQSSNLGPDPFYRNVQKNTQNPRTHPAESSSFSNTRVDHRSPQRSHPYYRESNNVSEANMDHRSSQRSHSNNRQSNNFSEANCFYPEFTQNLNPYSQSSQLNYYDDNTQQTSNRYNNRRGRY